MYGSVSDAFTSFDPDQEGDAAPINRAVGDGPVNNVNWLVPLERFIAGTDQREQSIRSNSFDEPITPSNYNSKATSTKGSAAVPAAVSNAIGFFVGKTLNYLYELHWLSDQYSYKPAKANLLCPEIGEALITRIAVQEEPDVRVHCVRGDGTAAVLVRDDAEDVLAWIEVETDGEIEDVCVLPGSIEDRVFYRVKRTINGMDVYYHEEWAREDQCRGETVNRQADSFLVGNQAASTTISGLSHLEGETVVLWADGKDLGTYTVASGSITASQAVTDYCVGLGYTADYKSAKMAVQTQMGADLMRKKSVNSLGLLLVDTHYQGLQFGPDFDNLDPLPLMEEGAETPADTVWSDYDADYIEFPGDFDTDARICLRAQAPRPCTVLALGGSIDRQRR
jgi:hypothetical protein